ncbi:tyrosine-type recombinase/integrase [Pseudomonas sp. GWSMS-1]|uniref:tyrosine-type recombinase/integrase n=1 Tax=Pseudomonas sp. GWSMS-1 TaxID=3308997 RepID=UPI003CEFD981
MTRPRKKSNSGLPSNLYFDIRRKTYRYRRATDGKWYPFGTDRLKAIDAAKQLNLEYMKGRDLVALVMGESTMTLAAYIEQYRTTILPKRELKKGTLDLYAVHFRKINKALGQKPINEITVRIVADFLRDSTPRSSNQVRALLMNVFTHAIADGLIPDNPAASTIAQKEKKKRKRHTQEGLKAIRDASPQWLKNAIDLALLTALRRGDVLEMRFDKMEDGFLSVIQEKTSEEADTAWIKYELTPELLKVIEQCRDDVDSPFLVHRKPERMHATEHKEHWSKVERRYLTRAFQEAREAAGCYAGWTKEELPGFHEIRAVSVKLYTRSGEDAQKIAGHATAEMTKNYLRDEEDVTWTKVSPNLDITKITE